jgi:hypothetical protein
MTTSVMAPQAYSLAQSVGLQRQALSSSMMVLVSSSLLVRLPRHLEQGVASKYDFNSGHGVIMLSGTIRFFASFFVSVSDSSLPALVAISIRLLVLLESSDEDSESVCPDL